MGMRAVVFGTAGHIDHGKTLLIKALTGTDCDRLPEEKRRGITLVLGFARLPDVAGEVELSFIDVPGHERLVHTMIAGAAGIDRALLAVAADEGVMPQTREHLDVLRLLGVRGGVVALTKTDLVSPDLVRMRAQELAQTLAGGPLAAARIVPCSAVSGAGIPALAEAVLACARSVMRREEAHRPFRLAVDRVFTLPGAGTIVTGTAHWGRVQAGDELVCIPSGTRVRVRGVQVHGERRESAERGERVALALAGVSVRDVPQGEQLLSAGLWQATRRLALDLELLDGAVLEEGDRIWVHVLAARIAGRVARLHPQAALGPSRRVLILLSRGVFAVPGDRVIVRRPSPAATLAGGEVLDAHPRLLRRSNAAELTLLVRPWDDLVGALAAWIVVAGPGGIKAEELACRLGYEAPALDAGLGKLHLAGSVVVARPRPPLLVARTCVTNVSAAAREILERAGRVGAPLAEFLARALPPAAQPLRDFYLAEFRRSGLLHEVSGRVFAAEMEPLEDGMALALTEFYRCAGFAAPSPGDAARALAADPHTVEGVVRMLLERKRLARVGGKWILHRGVLDEVVASLHAWGVESFDVAQFKERFGLTRKLAIPVLEWLDSERVTRREGERRRVLKPRRATAPQP
jgi:selenocysteine-specific elongation factor